MSIINNIKNVKKNYQIVKANPLAMLKFKFIITKIMLVVLIIYLAIKFYDLFMGIHTSIGYMTIVTRVIMIFIFIMIVIRIYNLIEPMKRQIAQYEKLPPQKSIRVDVKSEIDEILNKFDKK